MNPSRSSHVYVLARPDGRAFYVGQGQRDRIQHHEREARRGHECEKCHVIRQIWGEGGAVVRTIIVWTDSKADALMFEAKLIAAYGIANLVNRSVGGKGPRGFHHTEEARTRISAALQQRVLSPEPRLRISQRLRGHPVSDETRAKQRAVHIGRPYPEAKRLRQIGTKQSDTTKAKRAAANAKRYLFVSPEGIVTEVVNLQKFCRDNNLSSGSMSEVYSGKRRHHKG